MELAVKLDAPLPGWFLEVKEAVYRKIIRTRFAAACRYGDIKVMRSLIIHFWPFVDRFPQLVQSGVEHFVQGDLLSKFDSKTFAELLKSGYQILNSIQKDEQSHRVLWLKTSRALGLEPVDLDKDPLPAINLITETLKTSPDSISMLMRVVAVENVASSVSQEFLKSDMFKAILGNKGVEWFHEHLWHDGEVTHEQLAFNLAVYLHGTLSDNGKEFAAGWSKYIHDFVDLFVAAGEECAEIVHRQ